MKLVVDTNVLITFFWESSIFRKISMNQNLELISPEFALEEIKKHTSEILKKAKISKEKFKKIRRELTSLVEFIPLKEYSSSLKKAELLAKGLPEEMKKEFLKDIDFFALALKKNCSIWSNDKIFKKQSVIDTFTTREMIYLIF